MNTCRDEQQRCFEASSSSDDQNESSLINQNQCVQEISIDDAIDRLGFGIFQKGILVASGLCSAADAIEILILSFLSIILQREWDLTPSQGSTITSVVFAGAFVGTLCLGFLGDIIGRKYTFRITSSIISIFGILTAFVRTYHGLLLCRFMVGVGVGGVTIPFDTFAEFIPTSHRGRRLVYPSYFWTAGTILVPTLAFITMGIHSKNQHQPDDYQYNNSDGDGNSTNWRLFVILSAVPSIVATIVGFIVVPESPRWLLSSSKGCNYQKAKTILCEAALQNKRDIEAIFPSLDTRLEVLRPERRSTFRDLILSPKWYRTTLCLWGVWLCYACLYYGTILTTTMIFSSSSADNKDMSSSNVSTQFNYGAILASAIAELAGTTLVLFTVDRYGRTMSMIFSFVVGGSLVLFLCLLADASPTRGGQQDNNHYRSMALVLLSFFARMFIMSGSINTWILTAEIFSTEIRTAGHSTSNAVARIGGFVSPYIVSKSTAYPKIGLIMFAISLALATLTWSLPETIDTPMGGVLCVQEGEEIQNSHNDVHTIANSTRTDNEKEWLPSYNVHFQQGHLGQQTVEIEGGEIS